MVIDEQALSELDAEQLRQVSQRLLAELRHQRALNEKLAYECALLKRLKFAAKSERHSAEQRYARGEPILRMTGVDGQHASAGFALP